MSERFFAPCPRGLEAPLAAELAALGARDIAPADGGVAFAGELDLAYRANLESRIASRILWRVGGGAYRDERDLYALVHALDWTRHFAPDAHAARRRRGDALAADEPRVRDAARQGRRLRPLPRGSRRRGRRSTSAHPTCAFMCI